MTDRDLLRDLPISVRDARLLLVLLNDHADERLHDFAEAIRFALRGHESEEAEAHARQYARPWSCSCAACQERYRSVEAHK